MSISHVIVFLSTFLRFLSVHTSRELSGATDIAHTGDNQQSDCFADFFAFRVSVSVWDVVRQSTPCFLPQSQTYRNEKPSQLKSEDCKGCICPLYGGQDLIFFNNLYEPPISRFDMFAILSAWLRVLVPPQRPSGYESDELTVCSNPQLLPFKLSEDCMVSPSKGNAKVRTFLKPTKYFSHFHENNL